MIRSGALSFPLASWSRALLIDSESELFWRRNRNKRMCVRHQEGYRQGTIGGFRRNINDLAESGRSENKLLQK
jgi:hypothetical protein